MNLDKYQSNRLEIRGEKAISYLWEGECPHNPAKQNKGNMQIEFILFD